MPTSSVAAQAVTGTGSSVAGSLMTTLLSLVLVLAVIFVLAWVFRWMQGQRMGAVNTLRTHGGLQVGPKERVLHIQAGDQHLLIGVAPGRVQTLHVFNEAPVMTEAATPSLPPFAEKLRQLLNQGESN